MSNPKKRFAHIGLIAYDGRITTSVSRMQSEACALSMTPEHPWSYHTFFVERVRPLDRARNLCAHHFLTDTQAERLLLVDADMIPPTNWWRLLDHDVGAVSGIYLGWQPSGHGSLSMLKWEMFNRGDGDRYDYTPPADSEKPFEVDAAGAGCLCLSRSLLKRIEQPWFSSWDGNGLRADEDLAFFRKVNALGERCLVDPHVVFGHEKTVNLMDIMRFADLYAKTNSKLETPR